MSAVSELVGRYTVTDGVVIGSWLGWVALRFRAAANVHWKAGRHREANLGRVQAVGLWGLGMVAFAVGWKLEAGGGPTVWSWAAGFIWGLHWAADIRTEDTSTPANDGFWRLPKEERMREIRVCLVLGFFIGLALFRS